MAGMSEGRKLRVLLPHWMEHNAEHAAEFRRWAGVTGEAAADIEAAAARMDAANEALSQALVKLGGPVEHMGKAIVKAVCCSDERNEPKADVGRGELRADWGLVGDSHAGSRRPGRWQISLLAWEDVEHANREYGLAAVGPALPGSFAENLTTEGLPTASLKVGDRLRIGDEIVLEVEQLGKPPEIAHTYSFHGHSLLPTVGVFCGIVIGGIVSAGDEISVMSKE
jgi:MOSC domain-containing protein YiiM